MISNKKPRSVVIFEEYIQADKTREQYTYEINKFCKFYDLPTWDSLLH